MHSVACEPASVFARTVVDCPCSLRCGSRPWARVLQPRASREQEAEPCVVVLMGERIARAQSGHSCDVLQPRAAVSLPWTRAPCQLGWGRPHCPRQLSAQDWRHMPSAPLFCLRSARALGPGSAEHGRQFLCACTSQGGLPRGAQPRGPCKRRALGKLVSAERGAGSQPGC